MNTPARSRSRSAARLAAVQALYQQEMEGTPIARLLREFHEHRLGATIEDATYVEAEQSFFDDVVAGVDSRRGEIDEVIARKLAEGWSLDRLDRPMRAILRAGVFELMHRADVPIAVIVSEYVDIAKAFYTEDEPKLVNAVLDRVSRRVRVRRRNGVAARLRDRDRETHSRWRRIGRWERRCGSRAKNPQYPRPDATVERATARGGTAHWL